MEGTALNQVIFPCFLRSNLLNLFTCPLILRNLSSPTLSINYWHLSIFEVDTIDGSFDLLDSLSLALSPSILLVDLTLACRRSFSAFLMIFLAFSVLIVVFNLILNGTYSLEIHLRVKIIHLAEVFL